MSNHLAEDNLTIKLIIILLTRIKSKIDVIFDLISLEYQFEQTKKGKIINIILTCLTTLQS